jgi:drug/metabolite transporter (DMT)-like permease
MKADVQQSGSSMLSAVGKPLMKTSNIPIKIILAFSCIYFIWGSTYLAIRYAIQTIPPFLMAGLRFLTAGAMLYMWNSLRRYPRPRAIHWIFAAIVGGLLFLGGNGALVWAELRIPSGLAALLLATIPLWIVILDSIQKQRWPSQSLFFGLILGFSGVFLLVGPQRLGNQDRVALLPALVLVGGALCWAAGSLIARKAFPPDLIQATTAMEMIAGGVLLLGFSWKQGEWANLHWKNASVRSVLCLAYLISFGSMISFSAYIWLLKMVEPSKVATYAFVNPIVAVFLGWLIGGEQISFRILVAAMAIISAVIVITMISRPLKEQK